MLSSAAPGATASVAAVAIQSPRGGAGQGDPGAAQLPSQAVQRRMVGILGRDGALPDLGHTSPWRWAQPPPDRLSEIVVRRALLPGRSVGRRTSCGRSSARRSRTGSMSNCSVVCSPMQTRVLAANTDRVFPRRSNRGLRSGVRGGPAAGYGHEGQPYLVSVSSAEVGPRVAPSVDRNGASRRHPPGRQFMISWRCWATRTSSCRIQACNVGTSAVRASGSESGQVQVRGHTNPLGR